MIAFATLAAEEGWEVTDPRRGAREAGRTEFVCRAVRTASQLTVSLTEAVDTASGRSGSSRLDVVMASGRRLEPMRARWQGRKWWLARAGTQSLLVEPPGVTAGVELRDLSARDWSATARYMAAKGLFVSELLDVADVLEVDGEGLVALDPASRVQPSPTVEFLRELDGSFSEEEASEWSTRVAERLSAHTAMLVLGGVSASDVRVWRHRQENWPRLIAHSDR